MRTKLINLLQGKDEGFEHYAQLLQEKINENESVTTIQPVLHQTAASDGRLNTMIQLTVSKKDL